MLFNYWRNYEIEKGDTIAWSAFHASMLDVSADLPTHLLPLFYEKAAMAAMIKHGMNVLHLVFFGKGKKSAREAWKCYHDVTFMALHPFTEVDADAQHFQLLEHFTAVLYDMTSYLQDVDEARKELFCQKGKPMERLPPTQDALLQHSKRVAYQAGIWCTSEHSEQHAPTPKLGAGHLMRTANHGFRCGTFHLWPPRPVVNLLNVAARAKGDVVLGVHAKRQAGGAPNSAHC